MLVVIGPPFAGSDADFAQLARVTGLVAYDLRTKLRPDGWGIVRVLGDSEKAEKLAASLRQEGYRVALLDPATAWDVARPIVPVRHLELTAEGMVLYLRERQMTVPYAALLTVVRGEVQVGRKVGQAMTSTSSAGFRAVVPSAQDIANFQATSNQPPIDAFHAADLHFVTVLWSARIDARHIDFSMLEGASGTTAHKLDRLVTLLSERSGVRVDQNIRQSSLASFAMKPPPVRRATPSPVRRATPSPGSASSGRREVPRDEKFDAYSRLVAEAERQTRS